MSCGCRNVTCMMMTTFVDDDDVPPAAKGGKVLVTLGEKGALLISEEDDEEMFPCPKVGLLDEFDMQTGRLLMYNSFSPSRSRQ